jgi:hypothetical protein
LHKTSEGPHVRSPGMCRWRVFVTREERHDLWQKPFAERGNRLLRGLGILLIRQQKSDQWQASAGLGVSRSRDTQRGRADHSDRGRTYDRRAHTPCPGRRHGGRSTIKRAKADDRAQALRPHIEHYIEAGRTSSSATATHLTGIPAPNGGRWFPMQASRARLHFGITAPAT